MASSNAYTSGVPPFAPGDPLSASALEKMREADQRGLPQRSLGTYVRQTPSGTMVTPWRQPRRGTGTHPFKLIDATDKDGLKVEVIYGAVIDMMDWQEPKVIAPKIGEDENVPDSEGRRPKLSLPQGDEIDVFVVIYQGEHGRVDDSEEKSPKLVAYATDSMPEIENGTLYVHVARIKTVENEAEGEDEPSNRIERINQILGSHIVWPFKPDFVGWQQRNDENEAKAALWLGAGSKYIEDCDMLEDLHVKVQREEFDNGRDGDTVFELTMPEESDQRSVLTFDKNQERGIEVAMSEGQTPATRITVDRKTTVSGGLQVVSDEDGCAVGVVCVDEGGSLSIACKKENDEVKAQIKFDSEDKSILDMRAVKEKVIQFTEPEFDNGRDGDTQFMVRAPDDTAAVTISIDKNQKRGFEAGAGESSSWISLDSKTTVSPGFKASSDDTEATAGVSGPDEGGSAKLLARANEARIYVSTENASIEAKADQEALVALDSPSPEVSLSGSSGSTRVTTVDDKQISMREISFMSSDGKTPMKAWFLCSNPESESDSNAHGGHHADHHDGEGSQGTIEHGFHHAGHYVDPDHDPDDSGLGHGSHHSDHHSDHHSEHHEEEPHHAGHHTPV